MSGGRGWWLDLGGGRGHAQIADILVNVPAARKCGPDGSSCHTLRARCVPPYRSRPGRDLTAEENGLGEACHWPKPDSEQVAEPERQGHTPHLMPVLLIRWVPPLPGPLHFDPQEGGGKRNPSGSSSLRFC